METSESAQNFNLALSHFFFNLNSSMTQVIRKKTHQVPVPRKEICRISLT